MTMYIEFMILFVIWFVSGKSIFDCWKKLNKYKVLNILSELYNPYIHEKRKSLIVFIVNIVIKYLLNCTELSSSHLRSVGRRYNSGVNVSCLLPLEH